jgi:hypothetical protein
VRRRPPPRRSPRSIRLTVARLTPAARATSSCVPFGFNRRAFEPSTTRIVRLLSRALRRGPVAREASSVAIGEVIGGEPESDTHVATNVLRTVLSPLDRLTLRCRAAHAP